jgi:hypothetical protein
MPVRRSVDRMRSLIVALVLVAGTHAFADNYPVELPAPQPKRLRYAIGLSYAAMVAPMAISAVVIGDSEGTRGNIGGIVATGAMLFGPSAGHCYAGRCWTLGLGLRLAGAGVITAMVARDHYEPLEVGTIIVGVTAALSLWTTGLIWDAATLPRAVRRANREHALGIAPLVRTNAAGIALTGTL